MAIIENEYKFSSWCSTAIVIFIIGNKFTFKMNPSSRIEKHGSYSYSAKGPWNQSLNLVFPTKYVTWQQSYYRRVSQNYYNIANGVPKLLLKWYAGIISKWHPSMCSFSKTSLVKGFPEISSKNLVSQQCFNVILLLKHVVGCIWYLIQLFPKKIRHLPGLVLNPNQIAQLLVIYPYLVEKIAIFLPSSARLLITFPSSQFLLPISGYRFPNIWDLLYFPFYWLFNSDPFYGLL